MHVAGIHQHTSPLSLPTSAQGSAGIAPHYSEPYRLYNLDVFEYELDQVCECMSMYVCMYVCMFICVAYVVRMRACVFVSSLERTCEWTEGMSTEVAKAFS